MANALFKFIIISNNLQTSKYDYTAYVDITGEGRVVNCQKSSFSHSLEIHEGRVNWIGTNWRKRWFSSPPPDSLLDHLQCQRTAPTNAKCWSDSGFSWTGKKINFVIWKCCDCRLAVFEFEIIQGLMRCLVSTQIVNRLSLLARESHVILERQIETCALQSADFKVWIN